jgi:hypothetical protein
MVRNKMFFGIKKGITPLVTVTLLLLVSATVAISMSSWYNSYVDSRYAKEFYGSDMNTDSLSVVGTEYLGNSIYDVYVRNFDRHYYILNRISINRTDCSMLDSNVLRQKYIVPLRLNCSGVEFSSSEVYDIAFFSSSGTVNKKVNFP